MSLILDALRKSEAERRRGDLPALALELPPAQARRRTTPAWWFLLPAIALPIAATLWLARSPPTSTAPAEPVANTFPPSTISPRTLPPEASIAPVATVDGEAAEAFEQAREGLRPALAAGRGLMPANASAASPSTPPEVAPSAPAPTPTLPAPPPSTTTSAILALADLTPTERRALPPLKLSMHMYSAEPAQRFVILDGHRLGEGDRAGSAVVERIDPAGVILAADGRRLLLPLP